MFLNDYITIVIIVSKRGSQIINSTGTFLSRAETRLSAPSDIHYHQAITLTFSRPIPGFVIAVIGNSNS